MFHGHRLPHGANFWTGIIHKMIIRNGKTTQHNIHAPAQNSTEHRREKRPSKDILKLKLECSSARIALLLQTRDGKHTPKKRTHTKLSYFSIFMNITVDIRNIFAVMLLWLVTNVKRLNVYVLTPYTFWHCVRLNGNKWQEIDENCEWLFSVD